MDETSSRPACVHLDKIREVGHDAAAAGPRNVDCAVDHVEQLTESQACSAQEEPSSDDDGGNLESSVQNQQGGFLLRMVGSAQNVGLLFMAFSSFNVAMMGMFVKLCGKAGLSTWQIVLARSLIVSTVCLLQLARRRIKPWGIR